MAQIRTAADRDDSTNGGAAGVETLPLQRGRPEDGAENVPGDEEPTVRQRNHLAAVDHRKGSSRHDSDGRTDDTAGLAGANPHVEAPYIVAKAKRALGVEHDELPTGQHGDIEGFVV